MTHNQIKLALSDMGYSLSAAAKAMDRSYLQLYTTTTRRGKSNYVANSIAILLDKPIESVFPDVPQYHEKKPVNQCKQQLIDKGREKLIEAGLLQTA